ncbi:transposase [Hymenobacter daeguensis]
MKNGRLSETQPVAMLQQQASGQTVARIVREQGLGEATFYAWKSKYAGASVAEPTRRKHPEEDNRKLKQMFADLSLENQAIKKVNLRVSWSGHVEPTLSSSTFPLFCLDNKKRPFPCWKWPF